MFLAKITDDAYDTNGHGARLASNCKGMGNGDPHDWVLGGLLQSPVGCICELNRLVCLDP